MQISSLLLVLAASVAQADSMIEQVEAAIQRFENTDLSNWSFKADRNLEDRVETLHFGPGKPGKRTVNLEAVDGRPPTDEELDAFAKKQADVEPEEEEDSGFKLSNMITPGSLEFLHSDEQGAHFRFIPLLALTGEAESQKDLQGKLVLAPDEGIIRSMEIRNDGVFKPRFGVKIETLRFAFHFTVLQDGTPAPASITAVVKGKAFLVANFDQQEETTYRDYIQVETEAD